MKSVQARAQNASLLKASEVNMKAAALRKQSKAEMITILASLWSNGQLGKSEKVCRVWAFTITSTVSIDMTVDFVAYKPERERDLQIRYECPFSTGANGVESEGIVGGQPRCYQIEVQPVVLL